VLDVILTTPDLRFISRFGGEVEVDGTGTPIDVPVIALTNP
jgi:hypothetical protein